MATIHRLLCTHCTFGTSELESSSAENAGKVLGYSVRKSSLPDAERGQLRQVFRAVERLLSYGLPKDATAAHKETLSADTAPRRLIFFPNLGGWQVAGQVSYRTFDTSQPPRPGSYFADLIVAKAPDPRSRDPEPAWSPCDVLQLWGVSFDRKTRDHAGWWISSEDELAAAESEGPWKPIAPTSVAAVREPRSPLIDDDTAHRFLSSEGKVADPLVPARWWALPAERRSELVAHMLQATIQGPARGGRETVTIAAEPSVAAVLFYIVCRLLPRRIAAGVSFSTYEPAPERPLTGLVATTFLNEEAPTADLPPELAQRGFACNTFRDVSNYGRCQPTPERGYARRLVALAVANDWVGIDSLLAALDAEGLKAVDLDRLIEIDHLVDAYFRGEKPTGLNARRGPQEARFLRERFRGVLETQAASRADWPPDLVEAAIVCLEGDLENLWSGSEAVHALLARHLPVDGEGLGRLLEPPQGRPSPPQSLVAAAVVSATLRGKPPRLPSRFLKHCREAREGRNRAVAVDLLGAVIRGLPADRRTEFLVGADSASVTDLLIDVIRNLSPPERDGLRPALTESFSNAIKKLTAKDLAAAAELLHRQADAASWTAASHPGLQEHLDGFFGAVLDDAARELGRCLVDAAGHSRVARLQQWTDHARDRQRIGERLSHWKTLHDAVTRLAADAPAWRSWAKPAIPDGSAVPAAVAAIEGLRPFDAQNRITARTRQQKLATTVVQTFKQALPEGSDLRAGWETVGHWLDRALAEAADRKALGAEGAGSGLSTIAISGIAAGIAALIATLGLWGYSQGALDALLPEAWRRGERQVAAAPQDPAKATPPEAGKTPRPGDPATPNVPAASVAPALPAQPEPQPSPPLSTAELKLELKLKKGLLSVDWNHGELKDRIKTATLTWKGPNHAEPQPLDAAGGSAQIDTKGCGFGQYVVTLTVTPKQGQGDPVEKTATEPIASPLPQIEQASLNVRDGKPSLTVKVKPVDNQAYGPVSYRLSGLPDFSREEAADEDGRVRFELPDSVTPGNFQAELPQFKLATVVPQGTTDPVPLPPIQPPDTSKDLLTILNKKQHITPLADLPGEKAPPLCDLPWSLGSDQFDLWLMTPEFTPGMSLTLGQKDTGNKNPRWRCNATVGEETDAQEATPFLVGDFEFEATSPWQPQLQFKVAGNREKGHEVAYAALRCCRLCLVIAGQPVATCQLVGQSSLGPLKIRFPVPFKPIAAAMAALQTVPDCMAGLLLTQSKPEPITNKTLVLSVESGRPAQFQLKHSESENATAAAVTINSGALSIEKFDPVLKIEATQKAEKKITDAENSIKKWEWDRKQIPDEPRTQGQRAGIDRSIRLAEKNVKGAEQELQQLQQWNEFAESVRLAEFTVADWRIAWETKPSPDKSSLPSEIPGGTAVVLIQGTGQGDLIEFREQKKQKSAGSPGTDTAQPSSE